MNIRISRLRLELILVLLTAAFLTASAPPNVAAQQQATPPADTAQPQPNQDPLSGIDLTPEQRQQIRAAMEATKADRSAANLRLRKAQMAYDEALDADNPSDEIIEQRAREVGEAQAALMRARAGLEIRIRRILTPEQRAKLREIRLAQREALRMRRLEQRVENQNKQGQPSGAPNQRNSMAPGMRRNVMPRKPPL